MSLDQEKISSLRTKLHAGGLTIGEGNGITQQLAQALGLEKARGIFVLNAETRGLLLALAEEITRSAGSTGIGSRNKKKYGKHEVAEPVRQGDVLQLDGDRFDKVFKNSGLMSEGGVTKKKENFNAEEMKVKEIRTRVYMHSVLSTKVQAGVSLYGNGPNDIEYAVIENRNDKILYEYVFDLPEGMPGARTRRVYHIENGTITGIAKVSENGKVEPVRGIKFGVTFQPVKF